MKLDILAFGAHPDDVELSCSGTILKNISLGKKVGIIDLTQGELGTRGTVAIRLKEAAHAAKILGASFRENMKMADCFFQNDKKHQLEIIKKIREYKPEVVLANALGDRHPDHGRAAQLVADACFLSGLGKIETKLKGKKQEAWRPKAIYHYIQYRKLKPDFVINISGFMEKKMQSIQAFGSQFFNPDSKEPATLISQPQFFDYIKKREAEYGEIINAKYAEGFNAAEEYHEKILID
jgi:bacillithiol biosynthesis deacetylase BshB1